MVSAQLSNVVVVDIATVPELAEYYQEKLIYPMNIIVNLPIYLTVFGFLSIIILIAKYSYSKQNGGTTLI